MDFTELRQSEQIRNMNKAMLPQTKREGARVPDSVWHKRKNLSPFSKLPDVLVIEILSRLLPKSFFRCRSVCKTWLSLSSDSVHLNKHLKPTISGFFYNNGQFGACFVNLSRVINKVEVDDMISSALSCHGHFNILDCCNGLLLVKSSNKKLSPDAYDVQVYNPATRNLFTLWSLGFDPELHCNGVFSLAFDPQVFHQFHVIRFGDFLDIFLYEKGKLKSHKRLVYDVEIKYYSEGTFTDGRIHRLTIEDNILSVDPNNCSYEVIRPPNLENCALTKIGQSRGVLKCMSVFRDKRLSVWVLESYTRQEWTLKYQLSLDAMYPGQILNFYNFCIDRIDYYRHFAFHPDKDVLFMPKGRTNFVSLDLSTGKEDEVYILGSNIESKMSCWVYMPCYFV
ncbi:putative F-box protein At1g47730 [Carex rostrata]